jgi:polar amino acid transport system substrate-binding protein
MIAAAACGSSASGGQGSAASSTSSSGLPAATVKDRAVISGLSVDKAAAALVPASWKSKGTITVATNADYPPDEFIASDNTTIVGWDPDLGYAIAKVLGLKFQFVNTQFDEIIPGLAADRYDLGMSSAGVEPYREKVIDFVTDFNAGLAYLVPAGSSLHMNGLSGMCGVTLAVEKGSVEQVDAQQQVAACAKTGKKVSVEVYPDQNSVNLALSSNRVQAAFADSPVVSYEIDVSNGKFAQSGTVIDAGPEGIEIPKGNDAMRKALAAAMNDLISAGAYKKILSDWGVQAGAITHSQPEPGSGS